MKDENGIDINCENCAFYNSKYCEAKCTKTKQRYLTGG